MPNLFASHHDDVYKKFGWREPDKMNLCPECRNSYSVDALGFADDPLGRICNGCFRTKEAAKKPTEFSKSSAPVETPKCRSCGEAPLEDDAEVCERCVSFEEEPDREEPPF